MNLKEDEEEEGELEKKTPKCVRNFGFRFFKLRALFATVSRTFPRRGSSIFRPA